MNKELYEQGQKVRREVMGDAYVDNAAKTTTEFNRPFQELIAEYVWGTLWSRPGLDRRTRALINLSPEPVSNVVTSTAEDGLVFGGMLLALFVPLVFLVLMVGFLMLASWARWPVSNDISRPAALTGPDT